MVIELLLVSMLAEAGTSGLCSNVKRHSDCLLISSKEVRSLKLVSKKAFNDGTTQISMSSTSDQEALVRCRFEREIRNRRWIDDPTGCAEMGMHECSLTHLFSIPSVQRN